MDARPLHILEIMGGTAMFELNKQLKKWSSLLMRSESFQTTDIEELEDQVREKTEGLKEKGLTDEEAFWVAIHQVGDPDSLNGEYRKVNLKSIWKKRLFWLFGGYVLFTILHFFIKIPSNFLYSFWKINTIETGSLNTYFILDSILKVLIMAAMAGLVFSYRFKIFLENKVFNRKKLKKMKPIHFALLFSPLIVFLGFYAFTYTKYFISFSLLVPQQTHMLLTTLFENIWWYFIFVIFFLISLSLFREKREKQIS